MDVFRDGQREEPAVVRIEGIILDLDGSGNHAAPPRDEPACDRRASLRGNIDALLHHAGAVKIKACHHTLHGGGPGIPYHGVHLRGPVPGEDARCHLRGNDPRILEAPPGGPDEKDTGAGIDPDRIRIVRVELRRLGIGNEVDLLVRIRGRGENVRGCAQAVAERHALLGWGQRGCCPGSFCGRAVGGELIPVMSLREGKEEHLIPFLEKRSQPGGCFASLGEHQALLVPDRHAGGIVDQHDHGGRRPPPDQSGHRAPQSGSRKCQDQGDDEQRPERKQNPLADPDAADGRALELLEEPKRAEFDCAELPEVQQVDQNRDGGGGEAEQHKRIEKSHEPVMVTRFLNTCRDDPW